MNRPIYFELPSDNPEQLADFYTAVFGWKKNHWDGVQDYVMLYTGAFNKSGMNGGIMGRHMPGTVNTIQVEDIDLTIIKVEEKGGKVTTPKTLMEGLGFFAWCMDIDDNYFVLMQTTSDYAVSMQHFTPADAPDLGWVNRPIHFEIPGADPDKLAEFYTSVFGWKAQKWESMPNYVLMTTGPREEAGIDGAITTNNDNKTIVNTIGVEDIDACLEKIEAAGGKILMPKDMIPGVGLFTYCQDPDGNQIGILQPDMASD